VEVDFVKAGLAEVGTITSLEAPHRLADAILRDSGIGGKKFRDTEEGKVLDAASVVNATGLFALCPTSLVFGLWDSTGPRGGLGAKFQRALVSELVGIMAHTGVKPSSRIDPLGIQLNAGPLYQAADGGWTLDRAAAAKDAKGQPQMVGKEGKPSEASHGNVTPSLKDKKGQPHHGGVTLDHVLQTVVISLPALRRLRFPVAGKDRASADLAARTGLAALGLCAATLSISQGCDLRSRCLLVPEPGQGAWELVAGDGGVSPFDLPPDAACELLKSAVSAARNAGLPWREEPLILTPSAGLVALVKKSRELAMQSGESE
jgi:CRISPR-associated protein Csb1